MNWFSKADCLTGLKFFTLNDYSIQFVFYFIYINNFSSIYYVFKCEDFYSLLWETLTKMEHLLYYGRLKNLKGSGIRKIVEEFCFFAISLIGDPKVVFMDEPSTGLDPASRHNLYGQNKIVQSS
ncbi:putative ABC transporter A, ABCA, P-loop containing nucleoside triphosphate hydrolase [Rosa chinensis]|uniref:Putative ABC transporter A, ABCA, P-loop containing nucleoside triphosphate hydrolase n=1 Tax=Rosa chinensis TaxID=74649 RepID=A0A2P6QHZ1_ROSCH|nr:putative ABC transporter A, ABCA, P-loop containing nucleoside triphosphate hydrolase [Rosa chinensis]